MSRFLTSRRQSLVPYEPGEQPQDQQYVKLNSNESPFPPSPKAMAGAQKAIERMNIYPDPDGKMLRAKIAEHFNVSPDNVILSNGSDEVINFAYMAYCDEDCPAVSPDITYGFYPVFADINNVGFMEIPLEDDFSIDPAKYENAGGTIILANPNAQTGIALPLADIERIIKNNPDNVVVIDEAYVDFGAESCVPLTAKYDNLIVTQTLSKSRSLAGARLGFAIAPAELIRDLDTIRNSTNPYNISSMSLAAGEGVLDDEDYFITNCRSIIENRDFVSKELKKLGFVMTDSMANFILMKHPEIDGKWIYKKMKERGVLIRHFDEGKISQYNRVTIGSREQMEIFLKTLAGVLEEWK